MILCKDATLGLKEKLARQQDYDTVKKELAILRTLEFSSSSSSSLQQGAEGEGEEDSGRPLEVLLLERSKVRDSAGEQDPF